MTAWHATVYLGGALNEQQTIDLANLARIAGVFSSADQGATQVRVSLTSQTWERALLELRDRVRVVERTTGLAAQQLVLAHEQTTAAGVGLVGPGEVARMMGICRARLRTLRQTDPAFPTPALEREQGDVWSPEAIAAYDATRNDRAATTSD